MFKFAFLFSVCIAERHHPYAYHVLITLPWGGEETKSFMKKLFCVLALAGAFFTSCNEKVDPVDDGKNDDTPPTEQEQPQAPVVSLTAGEATTESLSFVITPENAVSVRYAVYEADATLPTAEQLLTPASGMAGTPADATTADTYTVSGLKYATAYNVVAAASNSVGYSELMTLSMKTATPAAGVSLSLVEAKPESVVFTLAPSYASKAAYVVVEAGAQAPEASYVIENGVHADAAASAEYTVASLTPETSYVIYAAALDLDGANAVLAEPLAVTTAARPMVAPAIGDFYYSDGTWSTELDPAKTPIAIVFYTGIATEFLDNKAYYKTKNGSKMDEFHGYAIALRDADPEFENQYGVIEDGAWWSFWDGNAAPTGVSIEVDDFLGYTNTVAIQSHCITLKKEFSASEDSYPAAYYATRGYEEVCPAPAQSSGWFLPSAYQLKYIWDQVYFNNSGNLKGWLENSFNILADQATPLYRDDAEYWSSTEVIDSSAHTYRAYYVSFDQRQFQAGFVAWYNKNYLMDVRSILAF